MNIEADRLELFDGTGVMKLYFVKRIYSPGHEICGRLELLLSQKAFVRGIWVKFSALNVVRKISQEIDCKVDLLRDEFDNYCCGLHDVMLGLGEESEGDEFLELAEGSYSWPFSFFIPCNSPLSQYDNINTVEYTLTATVDSPQMPRALSQVSGYTMMCR
jgi:hypothetical protein